MKYVVLDEMFKDENPKSVFEIGCANGGLLEEIVNKYGDIKVGGMDVSQSVLQCHDKFPKYKDNFYLRDLNDPWPIPDNSYDIVFATGVLMYLFEPLSVLREMYRVAKDKIMIAEYHHPQAEYYGQTTKGFIHEGKIQVGLIRNYAALFHALKLPMEIYGLQPNDEKTIFKCLVKKQ